MRLNSAPLAGQPGLRRSGLGPTGPTGPAGHPGQLLANTMRNFEPDAGELLAKALDLAVGASALARYATEHTSDARLRTPSAGSRVRARTKSAPCASSWRGRPGQPGGSSGVWGAARGLRRIGPGGAARSVWASPSRPAAGALRAGRARPAAARCRARWTARSVRSAPDGGLEPALSGARSGAATRGGRRVKAGRPRCGRPEAGPRFCAQPAVTGCPLASNLAFLIVSVVPTSRASEPDCTSSLSRCAFGLYTSSQRFSSP